MIPTTSTAASLVSQHDQLRKQILWMSRFLPDPEDLVQDSLLACCRKKGVDWSLPHPDYIIRSAKDQLARHLRRASSRVLMVSLETLQIEISDCRDVRGFCIPEVEFEDLHRAIESLQDNYRAVITKHAIEDRSFSDIADELGIREGNARQLWLRGLNQLRQSPILADRHLRR